jgi:hypothetical protein
MTARIRDFDDAGFDPFGAEEHVFGDIVDLHERLATLRAHECSQNGTHKRVTEEWLYMRMP